MARMSTLAGRAEQLLKVAVVSTTPLAGGSICAATRLRLSDGRSAFIKTRPRAPAGFFQSESRGLAWLADVESGVPVPEVLAAADDCLILSWIDPGRASTELADVLGRALAATHLAGADTFGATTDGYIGTVPLLNKPADSWARFWSERRLLPYVQVARDKDALSVADAASIERVAARIDELAGDPEPPSRLHGDLWSGNIVWGADSRAYLVDPAAYGGHRETDLAMLALFGGPHLDRIIDAYNDVAPLADGWRDRVGLHQLHPLLVHAILFGGSYGPRAGSVARGLLGH